MSRFIVIEGLDGVGKSTVINKLAEEFSGHAMSTPGPALHDIRQSLLDAFAHDELAKALFYTASVSSEGQKARLLADNGEWVFMDRYWASTLAYAQARGVKANLDALSNSLMQPDLTILLQLNETERQHRLQIRGTNAEDMETLIPSFRDEVLNSLQTHADLIVDISGLTEGATTEKISSAIRDHIFMA